MLHVNSMARRNDKEKALVLRKKGFSYSQIKNELGVSKSTLSNWLHDMPLSKGRLNELQRNDKVIEKIRATKKKKRDQRLASVFSTVTKDLEIISDREFFIAGFFLYWAEGGKTQNYSISLSNTDPAMVRTFIKWLDLLEVPKDKIKIKLHLYSDMCPDTEVTYWIKQTGIERTNFVKSYIKESKISDLTYMNRGHGTCNVMVHGRDISEYILQGLKRIELMY